MGSLITFFQSEAVAISFLVGAAINLAIVFGVQIDDSQKVAIITVVDALLALLARQNVTPTSEPVLPVGTSVNGGDATVTKS